MPSIMQALLGSYGGAAPHDIKAKAGTFAWTTNSAGTNLIITGVGFQPKVVLFFGVFPSTSNETASGNLRRSTGFATSSSSRRCVSMVSFTGAASTNVDNKYSDDAVVQFFSTSNTIESSLDFVSMDSDGFTVVVDIAQSTPRSIGYIALGGDSLTDVAINTLTEAASTGTQDITTPGFQPDFVLFLINDMSSTTIATGGPFGFGAMNGVQQFVGWANEPNNQATTDLYRYLSHSQAISDAPDSGSLTMSATFSSWLSNGFRLNYAARSGSRLVPHLSMKGIKSKIGTFNTSTTTSNFSVTGVGFAPKVVIFFGLGIPVSTLNTPVKGDILNSIGAASSSGQQFAIGYRSVDSSSNSNNAYGTRHGNAYIGLSPSSASTPVSIMDLVSLDADGFTCVMSDADNAATTVTYIALG